MTATADELDRAMEEVNDFFGQGPDQQEVDFWLIERGIDPAKMSELMMDDLNPVRVELLELAESESGIEFAELGAKFGSTWICGFLFGFVLRDRRDR